MATGDLRNAVRCAMGSLVSSGITRGARYFARESARIASGRGVKVTGAS